MCKCFQVKTLTRYVQRTVPPHAIRSIVRLLAIMSY